MMLNDETITVVLDIIERYLREIDFDVSVKGEYEKKRFTIELAPGDDDHDTIEIKKIITNDVNNNKRRKIL